MPRVVPQRTKRSGLLRLGTLLLLFLAAGAHDAYAAWQTYTLSEGLASNSITAMLCDRSGNLWFGTPGGGVSRYDGVAWRTFRTPDGLLSDHVSAIVQDSSGVLWFGTDAGVSRFDGRVWQSFDELGGVFRNPVYAMVVTHDGRLWVSTRRAAVLRYDGTTWTPIGGDAFKGIGEDHLGRVWAGSGASTYWYDGTTWVPIPPPLPANLIAYSVAEDPRGVLWISGETALWALDVDANTWRIVSPTERGVPSPPTAPANTGPVFIDREGAVWVVEVDRGVSRFDGERWSYFSKFFSPGPDPLPSDAITAIAQSANGDMWFGTAADGAARFDGSYSRTTELNISGSQLPFYPCANCGLRDHFGNVWFASYDSLRKFDGRAWSIRGLNVFGSVSSTLEDRAGQLWFGGTIVDPGTLTATLAPLGGASMIQDRFDQIWAASGPAALRYNGAIVESFGASNTAGALQGTRLSSIVEDPSGTLWFAIDGALATFDGSQWRRVREVTGATPRLDVLLVDRAGRLWGAGPNGLERFDGSEWIAYPRDVGFAPSQINSLFEDRSGSLWMGTPDQGAFRFDGTSWGNLGSPDGLAEIGVGGIVQDTSGTLWFEHPNRLTRLFPDLRPPRTVLFARPATLSGSRLQSARFGAAWGETQGIQFSTSFDGGPWSAWSTSDTWSANDVVDGVHRLQIRSRDRIGNTEHSPLSVDFEVDATPPVARLDAPVARQIVRDTIAVLGSASDARIREYRVEVRPAGVADWDPGHVTLLARDTSGVADGRLAGWDTRNFVDGGYDLRLSLSDVLGLSTTVTIPVTVDNQFPNVDRTSPALIRELTGGDVYTTHGEVHLYFAPHAFAKDVTVALVALDPEAAPATLGSGIAKRADGFEVDWPLTLDKPARMEIQLDAVSVAAGTPAIYFSPDGSAWTRLGGTYEASASLLTLAASLPGRYVVYSEAAPAAGSGGLGALSFTPRVFSPDGRFADREVGVSFSLGKPAPVTVRVFSLSGRLVRTVAQAQPMGAGQNLVRWDGRDREGRATEDGMYVVTVEALGQTMKKTLAVVR